MRLSTRMRYGSRVLVSLSRAYPNKTISISDLAVNQKISPKYLEQIMIPLRSAGLVSAQRGKQGGYTLTRSPEAITMLEAYSVLEGPTALVHCVKDQKKCNFAEHCPTRSLWKEVTKAMEDVLKRTTLRDLMERASAPSSKT